MERMTLDDLVEFLAERELRRQEEEGTDGDPDTRQRRLLQHVEFLNRAHGGRDMR